VIRPDRLAGICAVIDVSLHEETARVEPVGAPAGVATTLQPLHRKPKSSPVIVMAEPGLMTRPGTFARGPMEMIAVSILHRAAA
jgi:hypothetical protein